MTRRTRKRGYILVEALVAMTVLSIAGFVIHRSISEAIMMRGYARDYTQARFLVEKVVADLDVQPLLKLRSESGSFDGRFSRFRYEWTVSRITLPLPPIPPKLKPEKKPKLPIAQLGKISASVTWTRSGKTYSETVETLFDARRLFDPRPQNEE